MLNKSLCSSQNYFVRLDKPQNSNQYYSDENPQRPRTGILSKNGKFIIWGGHDIAVHQVNNNTGALTLIPENSVSYDQELGQYMYVTDLVLHPKKDILYVVDRNSHFIDSFIINEASGKLTKLQRTIVGNSEALQNMVINSSGTDAYIISNVNVLHHYKIDNDGKMSSPTEYRSALNGKQLTAITLSPNERNLYITTWQHNSSHNIETFAILSNGNMSHQNSYRTDLNNDPSKVFWEPSGMSFDPSGNWIYVTSNDSKLAQVKWNRYNGQIETQNIFDYDGRNAKSLSFSQK